MMAKAQAILEALIPQMGEAATSSEGQYCLACGAHFALGKNETLMEVLPQSSSLFRRVRNPVAQLDSCLRPQCRPRRHCAADALFPA